MSENTLFTRQCQKCGAPIAIRRTALGDTIALDLRAPVYTVTERQEAIRNGLSYADHRCCCPEAVKKVNPE